MAVAMARAGGAWRVITSDMAASVRCAVDPTRKVQQGVPGRSNAVGLSVARSSGDGAQLRCRAATLTAVREMATAEGVAEMRCMEESRAARRGSFEAASESGRAGCVGAEECRPVLEETTADMAAAACEQRRLYHGRRGGGDAYAGLQGAMEPADMARGEREGAEMVASFEGALAEAGRNAEALCELARRAWRKLVHADRAEQLFMAALQLAPHDSAVQASFAQFLWQCDVCLGGAHCPGSVAHHVQSLVDSSHFVPG